MKKKIKLQEDMWSLVFYIDKIEADIPPPCKCCCYPRQPWQDSSCGRCLSFLFPCCLMQKQLSFLWIVLLAQEFCLFIMVLELIFDSQFYQVQDIMLRVLRYILLILIHFLFAKDFASIRQGQYAFP
jgi:hypothetical protein